ncbi:MAG: hypothetical protein WCT85_01670 [Parachlamydiales bacterium]
MHVLIEPLICTLNNIQSKIDTAAGAATALEIRLRIIAQLEPKVQIELKNRTKKLYYKADLIHLIDAVIETFQDKLDLNDQAKIKSCRLPRHKTSHGSFAELMIELTGEVLGREIDPHTRKRKPLEKNDIIEGAVCIERNHGLEEFSKRAKEAIEILERKILRSLEP